MLTFNLGLPKLKVVAGGTGPATVLSVGHLEQEQEQEQTGTGTRTGTGTKTETETEKGT